MCRWPTSCTILQNFLFHRFFLALHVSNELLVHHQEQCIIYFITQYNRCIRAGESRLACSAPVDERVIRSKHVEQEKNGGIKNYFQNCASRWSSTHCIMFGIITTICCHIQSLIKIRQKWPTYYMKPYEHLWHLSVIVPCKWGQTLFSVSYKLSPLKGNDLNINAVIWSFVNLWSLRDNCKKYISPFLRFDCYPL